MKRSGSFTLNLNLEDCEALKQPVHHMCPPLLARTKNTSSTITLDMCPRINTDVDLRLKPSVAGKEYPPIQKSLKSQSISGIHAIPLVVLVVFVLLWVGSSEVETDGLNPEIFVMRLPASENLVTNGGLKIHEVGASRVLRQDRPPSSPLDSVSLENRKLLHQTRRAKSQRESAPLKNQNKQTKI